MKRLFEFLLPERTHLKAVIAALVAIFVLSGVLAYQVHESQKARAELEELQVQSFQKMAVESLRGEFQRGLFGALLSTFRPAYALAMQGGSVDAVSKSINFDGLCGGCAASAGVHEVVAIDLHAVESNDRSLALALQATKKAPFNKGWTTGAFATGDRNHAEAYAFLRNTDKANDRAWLVRLTPKYVNYIVGQVAFDPDLISPTFTHATPNDSLFRVDASLPVLNVNVRTSNEAEVAEPASVVMDTAFFPNLQWRAGLLQRGHDNIVPPQSMWLSPNLLLAMMALIGAVIVMAIALVRREEELHRLRSDLISGVSHELRTPLAQIRMFAETLLLGRTRTEAERRRSLEVIDQEAKRLSHFVENMLQFAKGEGGRTRLVPEATSFAVEVRRTAESFAPMCQSRGVDIRTELEDGVTAPVDRAALRRIMLNLLENALKYGPDEQRITVGVAIFNDVVRLWVDDEGEGIPRNDRERVFDSFFRLNRELDKRVTGSGIGLAVVRQLATLHGGRAWAEEAPGGGARLVVEFPDAYVRPQEEGTGWAVA